MDWASKVGRDGVEGQREMDRASEVEMDGVREKEIEREMDRGREMDWESEVGRDGQGGRERDGQGK